MHKHVLLCIKGSPLPIVNANTLQVCSTVQALVKVMCTSLLIEYLTTRLTIQYKAVQHVLGTVVGQYITCLHADVQVTRMFENLYCSHAADLSPPHTSSSPGFGNTTNPNYYSVSGGECPQGLKMVVYIPCTFRFTESVITLVPKPCTPRIMHVL